MDAKLAEIYGTNTPEEGDVEKLAAAELAEKLAGDESMDLSELEPEQIEALAAQVLSDGDEGSSEDEGEDAGEDEGNEKVAEADYLGRVMAHAYVQELRGIDKEAAKGGGPMTEAQSKARDAKRAKTPTEPTLAMRGENKLRGAATASKKGLGHVGRALRGSGAGGLKGAAGMGAGAGRAAKVWGARGGAAAAAAGLGLGAKKAFGGKGKKKKASSASALDILAEQRALEILEASGIELESGETKEASITEEQAAVLQQAVEARAVEMLEANGYTFEGESEEETE
jgi:hypothetical protein